MLALPRASDAVGQSFNIGNARSAVTIFDLAQRIKRLPAAPARSSSQPRNYVDVELRIPNVDKARELLGFDAAVDLDEGLERTIAWYREQQPQRGVTIRLAQAGRRRGRSWRRSPRCSSRAS